MASVDDVQALISSSGLLDSGTRVLVMLSGGADSVCLAHALRELLGTDGLVALHVNHGLRESAERDERFCADLCRRLGLELRIEAVEVGSDGNVEAAAREARYAVAEDVRAHHGLDVVATGHTANDLVETIIYRLVASPGRRALLGMSSRNGRIVRPLLSVGREQTHAYCAEAGLPWREDESNLDTSLARNRIRHEVMPELRAVHPAADANILATAAELRDESDLLDAAVVAAMEQIGAGGAPPAVEAVQLSSLPSALRRLILRRLAEQAAGQAVPINTSRLAEIERLARAPGSSYLDLGAGIRAACEYGVIRFQATNSKQPPRRVALPVPGRCRFGDWELICEIAQDPAEAGTIGSKDEALLDAAALESQLEVRSWSSGDRMQPLGLNGTKSLQDLFTDLKVPRSVRSSLPVVTCGDEIAWVAGVATSERFKVTPATSQAARLRAAMVAH
jgi:tRNA(Ile)-lysidine synthase